MSLNLPPAPSGFQGLHPEKPIAVSQRTLPHWRQEGATYFVTFRLADSLPQPKLNELRRLRERLSKGEELTTETRDRVEKAVFQQAEQFMDAGYAKCELADQESARVVLESLLFRNGDRWELGAATIMPNHVHAIIRPIGENLDDSLESTKQFTAIRVNRLHKRSGQLWQYEAFDRIIRDDDHLWRCIQYIGRNGRTAGVNALRWIDPAWEKLGWRFIDPSDER